MESKELRFSGFSKMQTPLRLPSTKYGLEDEKAEDYIQNKQHHFTTPPVRRQKTASCIKCESHYSLKSMPFRLRCSSKAKAAQYQECGAVLCKSCWLKEGKIEGTDLVSSLKLCKSCSKINFKKLIIESASSLLFGGRNSKETFHIIADLSILSFNSPRKQRSPMKSESILSSKENLTTSEVVRQVVRKNSNKLKRTHNQSISSMDSILAYCDKRLKIQENPEILHPYQLSCFDQVRYMLVDLPSKAQNFHFVDQSVNTITNDYHEICEVKCSSCHQYYSNLSPKIKFGDCFALCVLCVLNASIHTYNLDTEQETIEFYPPVGQVHSRVFKRFRCGDEEPPFSPKHFFLHVIKHAKDFNLPYPIKCEWNKQDQIEGKVMGGGHFLTLERSDYFNQNPRYQLNSELKRNPDKMRRYLDSKRMILEKYSKCVYCKCRMDRLTKKVAIILPASILQAICQDCLKSQLESCTKLHQKNNKVIFEILNPEDNTTSNILFDYLLPLQKNCLHGTRLFIELMQYLPVTEEDMQCQICAEEIDLFQKYPLKTCKNGHVICEKCAASYIEKQVDKWKNQLFIQLKCPADDCEQKSRVLNQEEIERATSFQGQELIPLFYEKHSEILQKREVYLAAIKGGGIKDETHPQYEGLN